jgi:hypothetical protein
MAVWRSEARPELHPFGWIYPGQRVKWPDFFS